MPPFVPRVPRSIVRASREELTDVPMIVHEGELPADLAGHVFMLAPCGSVESGGLPTPNETTVLNGDGMMYRFDFDPEQKAVRVTSRIAKSADYWADAGSHADSRYASLRFRDAGMVRLSIRLGLRNEINTAFVPITTEDGTPDRMLVTFDAGRPHEIDPVTLETITPVGYQAEWTTEIFDELAFPPDLTSAHPVWDSHTRELFTVNFQRSIPNFMSAVPLVDFAEKLPDFFEQQILRLADTIAAGGAFASAIAGLDRRVRRILEALQIIPSATYLVRWDASGPLERFKLVEPDGEPVVVTQTTHQLAVTRKYVVVANTAVKIGPDQAFNNPFPNSPVIDRLLRALTTRPETSVTDLWLVPRAALTRGQRPLYGEEEVTVVCQRVTVPIEIDHFLADYDDEGDLVTVHLAQTAASDVGEWIRSYDQNHYTSKDVAQDLVGQLAVGIMDLNRIGRYRIHGPTGQVRSAQVLAEDPFTWGITFYAGRDITPAGPPAERLTEIYWNSVGFFSELMTEWVWDLYEDYPNRLWRLQNMQLLPGDGDRPATLFRVHTPTMSIVDRYVFPPGVMVSSPQFVPRRGGTGGPTDGYIFCTVYTAERNEVWIFDGADLSKIHCRMHEPRFVVTLTLHTTWLDRIAPRRATYFVDPRADYEAKIAKSDELKAFFEEYVYPNVERHRP